MYPKVTDVKKDVLSRVLKSGVDIFKNFFNMKPDTAAEEGFTPPSTAKMVKQCLHYYLEPFQRLLLNEDGYPINFRLDEFIRQVTRIFEQHNQPVVQHQYISCATVTVDNLKDVRA